MSPGGRLRLRPEAGSTTRWALVALSLALLLTAAPKARAAGLYATDLGARALAVGGAFVAAPDSLLALHYNPAALAGQRGFLAELDVSLYAGGFEFQRRCPCVFPDRINDQDPAALDRALEAGFGLASSPARAQPIPFLAVGYGFEWRDLTVAAGVYGPHGPGYDFGARDYDQALVQAQRYALIEAESLEINYQLAVALSPLPGLRLGASFLLFQLKSSQYLHLYANTVLTPFAENVSTVLDLGGQAFDIPVLLELEQLGPNWSVGASYELPWGFVIGASFRAPRSIRAAGKLRAELPSILEEAGIGVDDGGGDVEVRFQLPAIGRLGLQFHSALFTAEAAVVLEAWSTHERIEIAADSVRLTVANSEPSSLGTLSLDRGWRDTASLRLGGRLHLLEPWLGISAGYFFEPSAIPEQRLSANGIDLSKHGLSLGLSTQFSAFRLELAVAHVFYQTVEVLDSEVLLPAALRSRSDADPDAFGTDRYQTRIGNGRYAAQATVGTLSLSFALDALE